MTAENNTVSGKSLVIISEDMQFANSLERLLLFAGARLQVATSGFKGIASVRNVRPDIVVFDDSITDMEPIEVLKDIQTGKLTKGIPVIVVSTIENIERYKTDSASETQSYIAKSQQDVLTVVSKIQNVLNISSVEDTKKIFDFSESDKFISGSVVAPHLRLLVVEDDSLLRNLLSMRLLKANIQHQFCNSGALANSAIEEYKPTIVILDLMLPEKNGLEVLEEMRSNKETADIPVIVFSNKDDEPERLRAKELGVTDFLIKATTDLSKLLALVLEKGK